MAALSRPPWWSPENLLARLREGETVAEQILEAERELIGRGVIRRPTRQTYRNDVIQWRRLIPGYDADYQGAMEECYARRKDSYTGENSGRPPDFTPEKQDEFFAELEANGGKLKEACLAVGISAGNVFCRLNEKHSRWDPEFAERYLHATATRDLEVIEAMYEEALTKRGKDEPSRNPLILTRLGAARLPYLLSEKKQIEIDAHHRHTLELPAEVTRQLATMQKALQPAREEKVIELKKAELVEVRR